MLDVTRIGAYALCRDHDERFLVVRLSAITPRPGFWTLPGGGIDFGEAPADAALRELTEETGLRGRIVRLLDVTSALYETGSDEHAGTTGRHHAVRVFYEVEVMGGTLRRERGGSTDDVAWRHVDALTDLPLTPYAREVIDAARSAGRPPGYGS